MAPASTSDERLREIIEVCNSCKTISEAETILGIRAPTIRHHRREAARRGLIGFKPVLEGFEVARISTEADENGAIKRTFVTQRPERSGPFEIPAGHQIKGVSALVDADGRVAQQWIKTREGADDLARQVEAIKQELSGSIGRSELVEPPSYSDADLLTVYPVTDTHLGQRSWAAECGADYDLKIAEKLILEYSADLIAAAPPSETAVILNLGDYFDIDNKQNRTPENGNPLDVDSRYSKIFRIGLKVKRRMAEMALRKHKRVELAFVEGNHDPIGIAAMHAGFEMFFEDDPRVFVDPDVSPFFWREFGRNFISGAHGDKLRPTEMPGFMAANQPEIWGRTKFRYAYFGHVHHHDRGGGEKHGVIWETLQTIAPRNAWAAARFDAWRSMKSATFHRERGKILDHTLSVTA